MRLHFQDTRILGRCATGWCYDEVLLSWTTSSNDEADRREQPPHSNFKRGASETVIGAQVENTSISKKFKFLLQQALAFCICLRGRPYSECLQRGVNISGYG
jgi:hypothetical protein